MGKPATKKAAAKKAPKPKKENTKSKEAKPKKLAAALAETLAPMSRGRYDAAWAEFKAHAKIRTRKPTEEDVTNWLMQLHSEGLKGSTILTKLSQVNTYCSNEYGFKIKEKFPRAYTLAVGYGNREEVKKSKTFAAEEVQKIIDIGLSGWEAEKAWQQAQNAAGVEYGEVLAAAKGEESDESDEESDESDEESSMDVAGGPDSPEDPIDAYTLVRVAMIVVFYYGALRVKEGKALRWEDLQRQEDGSYVVTQAGGRAKKRGQIVSQSFVVPSGKGSRVLDRYRGSVPASVLKSGGEETPLAARNGSAWVQGSKRSMDWHSSVIGINMLYDLGKWAAERLGLDCPDTYTGHCWRRSAATISAGNNATAVQMMQHFGWSNSQMPLMYIDQSGKNQRVMANILDLEQGRPPLPTKQMSAQAPQAMPMPMPTQAPQPPPPTKSMPMPMPMPMPMQHPMPMHNCTQPCPMYMQSQPLMQAPLMYTQAPQGPMHHTQHPAPMHQMPMPQYPAPIHHTEHQQRTHSPAHAPVEDRSLWARYEGEREAEACALSHPCAEDWSNPPPETYGFENPCGP